MRTPVAVEEAEEEEEGAAAASLLSPSPATSAAAAAAAAAFAAAARRPFLTPSAVPERAEVAPEAAEAEAEAAAEAEDDDEEECFSLAPRTTTSIPSERAKFRMACDLEGPGSSSTTE